KSFPKYSASAPAPSPEVAASAKKLQNRRLSGASVAVLALLAFLYASSIGPLLGVILGVVACVLFMVKAPNATSIEQAYKVAKTRLDEQETLWDRCNDAVEFRELKALLVRKKEEFDGLPNTLKSRLDE